MTKLPITEAVLIVTAWMCWLLGLLTGILFKTSKKPAVSENETKCSQDSKS